jgi:predicted DNA-binding helix-hairpin-helix protein
MDVLEKLSILTDAAKYDAACTSSGVRRGSRPGMIGNTSSSIAGCCHSFSADGRCITLLKVLMTNVCTFDCRYCVNRRSNDTRRAAFTPRELAELIEACCPDSREKSLAHTKVEEATMWANAAIARNE